MPEATDLFVKLYADDTFLCGENNNEQALEVFMNSELEKVYKWLCANKLTLNIAKSKSMIITRKRTLNPISVLIDNIPLEQCSSYKYLGVIFDKNLNWKDHIEYICY